jgi:hypothetical protein
VVANAGDAKLRLVPAGHRGEIRERIIALLER